MITSEELFSISAVISILSIVPAALYFTGHLKRKLLFMLPGLCSVALMLAGILLRWSQYATQMQTGLLLSFPVTTFYESVIFTVFLVQLFLVASCRRFFNPGLWSVALPLTGAAILLLDLYQIPTGTSLFLPSLQSYWLIAHVTLSFVSYAIYAIAAILALIALVRKDAKDAKDSISGLINIGTLIFTIGGIIFGALWAKHSWGRFWGWDPKETWAFITWVIYTLIIHYNYRHKISPRAFYSLVILAFFIVLFTFIGVNILFAGLHSYAALEQ